MLRFDLILASVLCVIQTEDVSQQRLLYAQVGENATLKCFYSLQASYLSWYRQIAGGKPQLMSSFYKHSINNLYNEFRDDPRFAVHTDTGTYHLSILNTRVSDSATYYCGTAEMNVVEFGTGTFLVVKESHSIAIVQQPVSEAFQPGDSVTLNCTIHPGTCAGEHSVYWFRLGAEESHPGILYTHGDRSGQCEKSPEAGSPTQSCVYHLPKRNLSLSDAGTYYCAVASCGEILFGDGTKLDFEGKHPILIYCLSTILAVCGILISVLACTLHKMSRRTCLQCEGAHRHPVAPTRNSSNQDNQTDHLHYAAVNLKLEAKALPQRSTADTEPVYSDVRLHTQE